MPTTWFITGANRGLGNEFVRQLSKDPSNHIFAAIRSMNNAGDVEKIGTTNVEIVQCDICDLDSIKQVRQTLKKSLKGQSLDYLINNSGTNHSPDATILSMTLDAFQTDMSTNVWGPAKVIEELAPLMEGSKRPVIMNVTSGLGSISKSITLGDRCPSYSISKVRYSDNRND